MNRMQLLLSNYSIQLFPDNQDIWIEFPDFFRVSLANALIPDFSKGSLSISQSAIIQT